MAEGNDEAFNVRESERNQVKDLMDHLLVRGETWYLLDVTWFNKWKNYVGFEVQWDGTRAGDPSAHPGPIDNSTILVDGELKEHLTEQIDYVLVPEEAWKILVEHYSLTEGQESLARHVVDQGLMSSFLRVEIYLTDLRLAKYPDKEKMITRQFSKTETLEGVEKVFRQAFGIPEERPLRLWTRLGSNQVDEELQQKKQSILELSLVSNQIIVGEVQNEDGSWPKRTSSYSKRSVAGSSASYGPNRYGDGDSSSSSSRYFQPGLCGLNNLGNTCFMNSVLQCMSNTPPIVRYFVDHRDDLELNRDNPLGNQGEIAKAFADLLKVMWSGQHQSFAPRAFKLQVGRFAPQFSGYQQHDAQELLTFLLDGLHEDLNRIFKKPYVEMKDADGRPDQEVAKEAWDNYRKRNDSVIVDLFHGLLKSTLVCPECGKVSVTFDPTCYLSLPMPVTRPIEVHLVPLESGRKPIRFRLTVPRMGTVQDLIDALAKSSDVQADRLLATEVHQHRFHEIFTPESPLSRIQDRDAIYVYELADKVSAGSGTCCLSVYLKEMKAKNSYGYGALFGLPMMLQVPREGLDYLKLYSIISERMRRYVKPELTQPEAAEPTDGSSIVVSVELPSANGTADESADMEVDEAEPADWEESVADNGNEKATANGIDSTVAPTEVEPSHLFTLEMVNATGNLVNKLKRSAKPISLPVRGYVACVWDPVVKETCYDSDAAEELEDDASFTQRPVAKKQVLQLRECLELFTTTERLGADDAWYCPTCKKHQRATKKFDLWSLPEVLVIHLKRFSYTRALRDKLDILVEFPVELDMRPYVNPSNVNHPPALYDLIGVCNHYGGLGGGHYTAYAKNKDDARWYYFDDSSVSESSEESVCSKAAYVLFYMRRNSSNHWLRNIKGPKSSSTSPAQLHKNVTRKSDSEDEEDMDDSS